MSCFEDPQFLVKMILVHVWLVILWFLFVRFSMMPFLNTKQSQSLQASGICIMKAKSLRYNSPHTQDNFEFFLTIFSAFVGAYSLTYVVAYADIGKTYMFHDQEKD